MYKEKEKMAMYNQKSGMTSIMAVRLDLLAHFELPQAVGLLGEPAEILSVKV